MSSMTKLQRFMAAIKGEAIDRLPVSMWLHFASEHLSSEETARLHLLERWRARLLNDEKALEAFITEYPRADIPQLRALIRNARKEQEQNKPPKSYREIFQFLKALEAPGGNNEDHDDEPAIEDKS